MKDQNLKTEHFDWDKGNIEKNLTKHNVIQSECEEVFFNKLFIDEIPRGEEQKERRYYALGITNNGRKITIIFTVRNNKIRVISARDMSRKERRVYEEKIKESSEF